MENIVCIVVLVQTLHSSLVASFHLSLPLAPVCALLWHNAAPQILLGGFRDAVSSCARSRQSPTKMHFDVVYFWFTAK